MKRRGFLGIVCGMLLAGCLDRQPEPQPEQSPLVTPSETGGATTPTDKSTPTETTPDFETTTNIYVHNRESTDHCVRVRVTPNSRESILDQEYTIPAGEGIGIDQLDDLKTENEVVIDVLGVIERSITWRLRECPHGGSLSLGAIIEDGLVSFAQDDCGMLSKDVNSGTPASMREGCDRTD